MGSDIMKGEIMSKLEKLISRVCKLSLDIRFDELAKILQYFGYEMRQSKKGSSHYIFSKNNESNIVIPKKQKMSKIYIKLVKEVIEKERENEKES